MLLVDERSDPAVAAPPAGRYSLHLDRCIVEFSVRHLVLATVRGRLLPAGGALVIDQVDPAASWVCVDLYAASVDTGNEARDEALRRGGLLAEEFPFLRFESTSVQPLGSNASRVCGDLYLRDAVVSIDVDATLVRSTHDRLGFAVTGAVSRRAVGLCWNDALERVGLAISDSIRITAAAEFVA